VRAILAEHGIGATRRSGAVDRLPHVHRLREDATPETRTTRTPAEEMVVCVCEQVTAAEIEAALTSRVPARSVEGVRKRSRATGGRCQGSVCLAGVIMMCANATGVEPAAVRMGGAEGTVGLAG
jgi:glycerol-3-phosphate dehydrogenase